MWLFENRVNMAIFSNKNRGSIRNEEELTAVSRSIDWRGGIFGLLLGAISFFMIFGNTTLIGSNHGWLLGGDSTTFYLAAAHFQQSPWTFPPGLNPSYGLEIPSSIMFADALPLFAFFFKIVYAFTGHTVQYLGYWLLVCFALQGLFGWMLAGQFTESSTTKLSVTLLLVFMPAFLAPMIQVNQFPCAGHFLILASMVIYFSPVTKYRRLVWAGFAVVAIWCNAYLFAMAMAIWCADVAARILRREQTRRYIGIEIVMVISAVIFALWFVGFFILGSGYGPEGFGLFRANLLALLDSKPGSLSYSFIWPQMPQIGIVAQAFVGFGTILLLLAAGLVCLERRLTIPWKSRALPLVIAVVLMFVYSLSNHIAIGSWEFVIPLPQRVLNVVSLLRTSVRFTYPLGYLAVVGVVYVLTTYVDRKFAWALFLIAGAVQVVDTSGAWKPNREGVAARQADSWKTPFVSPFWEKAGAFYKDIREYPAADLKRYTEIAYFALNHRMRTNAVYLNRVDMVRLKDDNDRFVRDFKNGRLDSRTIYVVDDPYLELVLENRRPDDLLELVDGVFLLMPGARTRAAFLGLEQRRADDPAAQVLVKGGYGRENDGPNWRYWTSGRLAFYYHSASNNKAVRLKFTYMPAAKDQSLTVTVNSLTKHTFSMKMKSGWNDFISEPIAVGDPWISVRFESSEKPVQLSPNDPRIVSFLIQNLDLLPYPDRFRTELLLGTWLYNGECSILSTTTGLMVTNEVHVSEAARWLGGVISVPAWNISGTLSADARELHWSNGATWRRQ